MRPIKYGPTYGTSRMHAGSTAVNNKLDIVVRTAARPPLGHKRALVLVLAGGGRGACLGPAAPGQDREHLRPGHYATFSQRKPPPL